MGEYRILNIHRKVSSEWRIKDLGSTAKKLVD